MEGIGEQSRSNINPMKYWPQKQNIKILIP